MNILNTKNGELAQLQLDTIELYYMTPSLVIKLYYEHVTVLPFVYKLILKDYIPFN